VRVRPGEEFAAARGHQLQRDLVGHRAGRAEQRRLVPEQRRHLRFQRGDRRVVAEDVVADLSLGHRRTHRSGRPGDRVGP
jgi:hypothetical protein